MADITGMLFGFLLQLGQPAATEALRDATTGPRDFRPQSQALPDIGAAVLNCYHPTGRFRSAEVVQRPWAEAGQWQASTSVVIRIHWSGAFTGQPYATDVAILERTSQVRGVVLASTAALPPSRRCALESWQGAAPAR